MPSAEPLTSAAVRIRSIADDLATAAQAVYNDWSQDEDGHDEVFGAGGICDVVAASMACVIAERLGIDASTQYIEMDCHTVVIAAFPDGVFEVDIPPHTYERGFGYVWTKIPGVAIKGEDIVLRRLSRDPADMHLFVEGMDGPEDASHPSP